MDTARQETQSQGLGSSIVTHFAGVPISHDFLMAISHPAFGHDIVAKVAWTEVAAIRNVWADHLICTSLIRVILNDEEKLTRVSQIDKNDVTVDEIGAVWDLVEELGGEQSLLTYARQLFQCSKVIYSLRCAYQNTDMMRLQRAIEDADANFIVKRFLEEERDETAKIRSHVSNEVGQARLELNDWLNLSELRAALAFGMARGSVGHLNLASIELEMLDTAIASVRARGCATEVARVALTTGQLVRRIRSALKFMDWASLRSALEAWDQPKWQEMWQKHSQKIGREHTEADTKETEDFKTSNTELEIRCARAEIHNRDIIHLLDLALRRGNIIGHIGSLDLSLCTTKDLDAAIKMCEDQRSIEFVSEEAKTMLYTAKVVHLVRGALLSDDYRTLEKVLSVNYAAANEPTTAILSVNLFNLFLNDKVYGNKQAGAHSRSKQIHFLSCHQIQDSEIDSVISQNDSIVLRKHHLLALTSDSIPDNASNSSKEPTRVSSYVCIGRN